MKQKVSRAQLKTAVENQQWDLLDKLLETDNSKIDDNALFTDTWGEWWGLLMECIYQDYVEGVNILLKHGASKKVGNWGDCIPETPLQAAEKKPQIKALLTRKQKPEYTRKTEPEIPALSDEEKQINKKGEIRDNTGLMFQ